MTIKAKELRRNREPCGRPGCRERAEARGLCDIHYHQAARVVRSGRRSWEQLEAAGKAKPARPQNYFLAD